jgi:hypothetical protein
MKINDFAMGIIKGRKAMRRLIFALALFGAGVTAT